MSVYSVVGDVKVKVQSIDQFDGAVVFDGQGPRIGRIVGAQAGTVLFTAEWLILRVPWHGRRAVAADDTITTTAGLQVQQTRADVVAPPLVHDDGLWSPADRRAVTAHYAACTATP